MEKKTIGIIFGGCSKEYGVSLKSAYSVIANVNREKYEPVLIGITKEGEWFLFEGALDAIRDDGWREMGKCTPAIISPSRNSSGLLIFGEDGVTTRKLDAVFPVLHGRNGEDGTVQGLLELAGIPVVGCGLLSSAICMDKAIAHILVSEAGVKVPAAVTFHKNHWGEEMRKTVNRLRYPLYVKPVNEGSSLGITKIEDQSQLEEAVRLAFEYDPTVIVEENIPGFEVGCAVLGTNRPVLGKVDEIEVPGGFFDFKEKYTQKNSHIYMPARIDDETARRIQDTALTIYRALRCAGFARVDMFLTPDNEIYFNEVNTIPGLTSLSRYPKMMSGVDISYDEIINRLIQEALGE